jgi:hypothetical protein
VSWPYRKKAVFFRSSSEISEMRFRHKSMLGARSLNHLKIDLPPSITA